MGNKKSVMVIDSNDQLLSSTRPGNARKLLSRKRAVLVSEVPPAIKLKRVVDIKMGGNVMDKPVKDIAKYLRENETVYVQNVSNTQISLTFYDVTGRSEPFTIPNVRIPFCLTAYIPFSLINNSVDFRKHVQRRPARLRVLTEEEYKKELVSMQRVLGISVDVLEQQVSDAVTFVVSKITAVASDNMQVEGMARAKAYEKQVENGENNISTESVIEGNRDNEFEEAIKQQEKSPVIEDGKSATVVGICNRLRNAKAAGNGKAVVADILMQLAGLELSDGDLEYIKNNGEFKKVTKWATDRKNSEGEVEDEKKI